MPRIPRIPELLNPGSGRVLFHCSIVLLLLLSSCAQQPQRPQTFTEIEKEKERKEDWNFFYGGWWPQKLTPEEHADRQYFYNSMLEKE
ncbi:MAG: hypothetical protein WCH43_14650 [Verrucomicrobiota bacterium]